MRGATKAVSAACATACDVLRATLPCRKTLLARERRPINPPQAVLGQPIFLGKQCHTPTRQKHLPHTQPEPVLFIAKRGV